MDYNLAHQSFLLGPSTVFSADTSSFSRLRTWIGKLSYGHRIRMSCALPLYDVIGLTLTGGSGGMHGGHQALLDAKLVIDDLR